MGKVIHRVDAPLVTGLVVGLETDTVQCRITHAHKRRRHIDFGTQYTLTLFEFAVFHLLKQRQILFHRGITVGAVFTRLF